MNVVFDSSHFAIEAWQTVFASLPQPLKLYRHTDIAISDIDVLLLWKPTRTDWSQATRLKLVVWLGAGVDTTRKEIALPPNIPEERLKDGGMKEAMCDYALYGALYYQRRFDYFQYAQMQQEWLVERDYQRKSDIHIGVIGLGHLGGAVAQSLSDQGYRVSGWSRSAKTLNQVTTYAGLPTLDIFLAQCQLLINMLPHTEETQHLLNHQRLSQLPSNAAIISLSRGAVINTAALLQLIDSGHLRGALMDVFEEEPLPKNSPLWNHPKIVITPHQSAPTQPLAAAQEISVMMESL